jgi:6-phosphofructo-2-kinase/fructose-2,6-biphosphatase 2
VTLSRINGYLQSRIAFYLMNLHLKPRSIYLSRVRSVVVSVCAMLMPIQHGESQFNVEGKIGGDSMLSPRGMLYMRTLPALITDNIGDAPLTASHDCHSPCANSDHFIYRCGHRRCNARYRLLRSFRITN